MIALDDQFVTNVTAVVIIVYNNCSNTLLTKHIHKDTYFP